MVMGMGIDSVEISRIKKAMGREGWLERLFCMAERDGLKARGLPGESVAGLFAAKEAVGKALGISMSLRDFIAIEILSEHGRPCARLHENIMRGLDMVDGDRVYVSISHDKTRAVAVALWERRG